MFTKIYTNANERNCLYSYGDFLSGLVSLDTKGFCSQKIPLYFMSVTFSRACTTCDFTECAALSLMVRYVSVVCSGVHRPPKGAGATWRCEGTIVGSPGSTRLGVS